MLSVILLHNGEDSVVDYTYKSLYKELKDIPGFELLIASDWIEALDNVRNNYVCIVEADCLVSPGYFDKQITALTKTSLRKIAMLTGATAVSRWKTCHYGYYVGGQYSDSVIPITRKKSSSMYAVQIGYFPGSLVRLKMLKKAVEDLEIMPSWKNDLVFLSAQLSLAFWRQGRGGSSGQNGNLVYVNPNVTYVTTEDYVNDISQFDINIIDLAAKFEKESI